MADNTLLDNDRVAADLKRYFIAEVGEARAQQYWEIFEELRNETRLRGLPRCAAAVPSENSIWPISCSFAPLVPVMQPADFGHRDNRTGLAMLDSTRLRRVLPECQMRPRSVVIGHVAANDPSS